MQSLTYRLVLGITAALLLGSCAGGSGSAGEDIVPRSKILACKSGDQQVDSASQCLQDAGARCFEAGESLTCGINY